MWFNILLFLYKYRFLKLWLKIPPNFSYLIENQGRKLTLLKKQTNKKYIAEIESVTDAKILFMTKFIIFRNTNCLVSLDLINVNWLNYDLHKKIKLVFNTPFPAKAPVLRLWKPFFFFVFNFTLFCFGLNVGHQWWRE